MSVVFQLSIFCRTFSDARCQYSDLVAMWGIMIARKEMRRITVKMQGNQSTYSIFFKHCDLFQAHEILETIFLELCVAQGEMHLTLSAVIKRWSEIVHSSSRERVHNEWLDRRVNANSWGAEVKRQYGVPFAFLKCINCNCNSKPEFCYWLDQRRCTATFVPNVKLVLVHGASKSCLIFKQHFFHDIYEYSLGHSGVELWYRTVGFFYFLICVTDIANVICCFLPFYC